MRWNSFIDVSGLLRMQDVVSASNTLVKLHFDDLGAIFDLIEAVWEIAEVYAFRADAHQIFLARMCQGILACAQLG